MTTVVEKTWKQTLGQYRIEQATQKVVGVKGGIRSGKTFGVHMRVTDLIRKNPGMPVLCVRKHKPELRDSVWFWTREHPKNPFSWKALGLHQSENKEDMNVYLKVHARAEPNVIHYRAAYRDGKEDPSKFGSTEYGVIWVEEADELKKETLEYLEGRMSSPEWPNQMFCSFNPPRKSHWIMGPEWFGEGHGDTRLMITCPTRENLANLREGFIADLERTYSKWWIKRYLDGECIPDVTGNPVHAEYDPDRHVAPEPIPILPNQPLLRGWDAHPIGIYVGVVWAQYVGGRLNVLRSKLFKLGENAGFGDSVDEAKRMTRMWFPDHASSHCLDMGDPSIYIKSRVGQGADLRALSDIMAEKGINFRGGETAFTVRRQAIGDMLSRFPGGKPMVQIDPGPDCDHLREGLEGGYALPEGEYVTGKQILKTEWSHECEALQYIGTGLDMMDWDRKVAEAEKRKRSTPSPTNNGWMAA